jgi:hypothetical protein
MNDTNEFLLYTGPSGDVRVEVWVREESVWLSQADMAALFGVQVPAISKHIKAIFQTGELIEEAVVSALERTAADGKSYETRHYNLDVIIAVGYRVNSRQATGFRIWATGVLREYLVKGFALDGRSARASGASTRRSPTSTSSRSTTTRRRRSPGSSSHRCRTSCTGRSPARPPRN